MKTNVYKISLKNKQTKLEKEVYVAAGSLVDATTLLIQETSIEDELINATLVSEDCFVKE
jgi:hypothetical protein